jgi:hypothetical protein
MFTPKTKKAIALFLCFNMFNQLLLPTVTWALTSGPSQPEVQSFEPVGTTDMVDLSSGDFNYNIPLLDVEGYPINIAYHSGVNMDQEATWVGLGWNLNVGTVNRNMRGLPDDFNGEEIERVEYTKPNYTVGVTGDLSIKFAGKKFKNNFLKIKNISASANASLSIFYNNYRGIGSEFSIGGGLAIQQKYGFLNVGSSLSSNSQSGFTTSNSYRIGLTSSLDVNSKLSIGFGNNLSMNSRTGLKTRTFSANVMVNPAGTVIKYLKDAVGNTITTSKDANGESFGLQGSHSYISYGYGTVIPSSQGSYFSTSFSGRIGIGSTMKTFDIIGGFTSFTSTQYAAGEGKFKRKSYGYLYEEKREEQEGAVYDYVKEKENTFTSFTPNLPVINHTYDLLTATGQGMLGMFRAYRGDIGYVSNPLVNSETISSSDSREVGIGDLFSFSAEIQSPYHSSYQKMWTNALSNSAGFSSGNLGKYKEPFYFKFAGEKTKVNTEYFPHKNLDLVMRPAILDNSDRRELFEISGRNLVKQDGNDIVESDLIALTGLQRGKREIINSNINIVFNKNKEERIDKYVYNVPLNASVTNLINPITNRGYIFAGSELYRKDDHILEISSTAINGSKYVYGLPVYNRLQHEISFTVNSTEKNLGTQTVTYDPDLVSRYNKGESADGYDGYYNSTKIPAYAHSYLLTSVISPDYIDVGNDGFDNKDIGNYTKFNYTRTHNNYKWRTPMTSAQNNAGYNPGLLSDEFDDKANIIYGEKEIWYLHSVESKNMIAVFKISAREDGREAVNIHGGVNQTDRQLFKLDEIILYNKTDLELNGLTKATPIKTVHFEYNYSLCPNTVNSTAAATSGKLTLTKIYFTYGKSAKGKLSSYQFNYTSQNPIYDPNAVDRWGTVSKINGYGANSLALASTTINSSIFPYTAQNKTEADENAKAWLLEEIILPSGGRILLDYESDDYAYVQNKEAMSMYMVTGFSNGSEAARTNELYDNATGLDAKLWVDVKIHEDCASIEDFLKKYIPKPTYEGSNEVHLYYSFNVQISEFNDRYEQINGYVNLDYDGNNPSTFIRRNSPTSFSIKVKSVLSEDTEKKSVEKQASPFAKDAWQFIRLNLPQYAYLGSNFKKYKKIKARTLFGFFAEIYELFDGANDRMLRQRYAYKVDTDKSFVKLRNGTRFKYGGGTRVKSIKINDNWNNMTTGESESSYGQEFDYTTKDGDETISSGVATYEPAIGNDENALKTPNFSKKKNSIKPDEEYYVEAPFGESFFPAPTVTYSKVTVRNIIPANVSVKKHGTGFIVNEFYTSKDFPVIARNTSPKVQINMPKVNWLRALIFLKTFTNTTVAQGYQIELNDMNGREKSVSVYSEPDNQNQLKLISRKEYIYHTDANNPNKLSNHVDIINSNGAIEQNVLVGVEADMIFEGNYDESKYKNYGLSLNIYAFTVLGIPAGFPIPFPIYQNNITKNATASSTRVIHRFGILKKVIITEDNATITQTNLAFDEKTGEVLLSKIENEFKDDVYNITYPAHWAYPGMSHASEYEGISFSAVLNTVANGTQLNVVDGENQMSYMDYLKITTGSNTYYRYYTPLHRGGFNLSEPIDGISGNTSCTVTIIRSGRNNVPSTPIFNATTLVNPASNSGGDLSLLNLNNSHQIINAGGVEFDNVWPVTCDKISTGINSPNSNYQTNQLISFLNHFFSQSNSTENTNTDVHNYNVTSGNSTPITMYESLLDNPFFNPATGLINDKQYSTISSQRTVDGQHLIRNIRINTIIPFHLRLTHPVATGCHNRFPTSIALKTNGDNSSINNGAVTGSIEVILTYPAQEECSTTVDATIEFNNLTFNGGPAFAPERIKEVLCENTLRSDILRYFHFWRKKKAYAFLNNRTPTNTGANGMTNQRIDGSFIDYEALYRKPQAGYVPLLHSQRTLTIQDLVSWKWTSNILAYDKSGNAIEANNPLNIYDAALTDDKGMVVASAKNARRAEIGFDGLEISGFGERLVRSCYNGHWNMVQTMLDTNISHTGYSSAKVLNKIWANYPINNCELARGENTDPRLFDPTDPENYFRPNNCESCISSFQPIPGKRYIVSAWVRINPTLIVRKTNIDADLKVQFVVKGATPADPNTITTLVPFKPKGPIIDGWQKIEGEFLIPVNALNILIEAHAARINDTKVITYYDDFRIFPKGSVLTSYVYHPYTNRLMAELDENNFATYYEYDEQGALKRVKRETERGVMTIKESRNNNSIR